MSKRDEEHPEDRLARLDSEVYARDHIKEFVAARSGLFEALVATYADDDARFILDHLRAQFWGQTWKPAKP